MTDVGPDEIERLKATLEPWLEQHRRPAWKGATRATLEPGAGDDAPIPSCGACGSSLDLLLRLDIATFPPEMSHPLATGIIELFYCNDSDWCETEKWEPYSDAHHIRIRDLDIESMQLSDLPNDRGWVRTMESPDLHDLRRLGAEINFSSGGFGLSVPEAGIEIENVSYGKYLDEVIGTPATGYKLGGWPNWVQYRQHPSCQVCDREMTYLYQVDEGFGDGGCGYLNYCQDHPEVMAFFWQCH